MSINDMPLIKIIPYSSLHVGVGMVRFRFYSNTYETIPILNDSDSDSFNISICKNHICFSNEYFQLLNNCFNIKII